MKKQILIALLGVLCLSGTAQNEIDAYRYSLTNYEGSARYMGMGGAFGSLGGDVSAIGINPASMARFSKNEFSFSIQSAFMNASTDFYGQTTDNSKGNFNIPNIGFVGTHNFKNKKAIGWQSVQFGLTYNRQNNFNENISIAGDPGNSYSLVFADWAEGTASADLINTNNYDSYLAYETYLIDPDPIIANNYISAINGGTNVLKTINRTGNMASTELALSGNYANKIYVGGSIGIPTLRFNETATHYESVSNDTINQLDNFTYTQNLKTTGSGFNFKAGLIVLPLDGVRIGLSYQTPTAYRMSDRWGNDMTTNFDNGDTYSTSSDPGSYVYKLRTPAKLTASASIVVAKRAAISIDYEMKDYARAQLSSTAYSPVEYSFTDENTAIGNVYRKASTIRLGAEVKLGSAILVRAGAQYRQSALVETNAAQINYSAGLGFRNNNFYIDAAYVISTSSEDLYLYDPALIDAANINKNTNRATVTVGFRY